MALGAMVAFKAVDRVKYNEESQNQSAHAKDKIAGRAPPAAGSRAPSTTPGRRKPGRRGPWIKEQKARIRRTRARNNCKQLKPTGSRQLSAGRASHGTIRGHCVWRECRCCSLQLQLRIHYLARGFNRFSLFVFAFRWFDFCFFLFFLFCFYFYLCMCACFDGLIAVTFLGVRRALLERLCRHPERSDALEIQTLNTISLAAGVAWAAPTDGQRPCRLCRKTWRGEITT
jgi:hypothetical protein